MRQYRDRLQLRTQRQRYTPPIEQYDPADGWWDSFNLILAILVLIGVVAVSIYGAIQ